MPVRAAAMLLLLVSILATGCGRGHERRDAVDRYVRDVNTIQGELRRPLIEVVRATRGFGTRPNDIDRTRPRLAAAMRTLATLERRLERLDPPTEARRLHALLLHLVSRERKLAGELLRVTVVLPQLSAATSPVAPAGKRLQAELKTARTGNEQAAALDRYRSNLAPPLAALHALAPPPLLRPLRATQVAMLVELRRAAAQLATALRRRRQGDVTRLLARFQAAARSGDTVTAQRARISAIEAYNARVKAVSTLAARVERERYRLDRDVR